jgi:hypothetical protein
MEDDITGIDITKMQIGRTSPVWIHDWNFWVPPQVNVFKGLRTITCCHHDIGPYFKLSNDQNKTIGLKLRDPACYGSVAGLEGAQTRRIGVDALPVATGGRTFDAG